jgi:hypothetical protein
MTVGQLKVLIEDVDSNARFEVFNSASEQYGIEEIGREEVWVFENALVISLDGQWDERQIAEYYKSLRGGA